MDGLRTEKKNTAGKGEAAEPLNLELCLKED